MISKEKILSLLPELQDKWVLVAEDQSVKDIMKDMIKRHREFERYYDKFSCLFASSNENDLSQKLFDWTRENIKYREEPREMQTTALPTGILSRGFGDCKHFAGFIGGVIDSLNRQYGYSYDWQYVFAGYNGATEPYHVYVSLYDPETDEDIWIDPTPGEAGEISVLIGKKP